MCDGDNECFLRGLFSHFVDEWCLAMLRLPPRQSLVSYQQARSGHGLSKLMSSPHNLTLAVLTVTSLKMVLPCIRSSWEKYSKQIEWIEWINQSISQSLTNIVTYATFILYSNYDSNAEQQFYFISLASSSECSKAPLEVPVSFIYVHVLDTHARR